MNIKADRFDRFDIRGTEIIHKGVTSVDQITKSDSSRIILLSFFIILSMIALYFQATNIDFFSNIKKYFRIKNNINGWANLIQEQEVQQENKFKRKILESKKEITQFQCVDMGYYYIPLRINPKFNLPESIQRGNGSAWKIQKSASSDLAAYQFCQYTINNNFNYIRCGIDSFDKTGISGWFNPNHWCTKDTNNLLTSMSL